jgi:hypothetical protein
MFDEGSIPMAAQAGILRWISLLRWACSVWMARLRRGRGVFACH